MFSVVSALALLGLASVIIPLLIHLFNPGKGRLVWIGNINLLRLANHQALREMRLTRRLLLLLRLLILVLITLLLAGLWFHEPVDNAAHSDKTLRLLSGPWIRQASDQQLTEVLASGDEVLLLSPGFSALDRQAIEALRNGPLPDDQSALAYGYWPLLAYLDQQRSGNETFALYSLTRLAGFDHPLKVPLRHKLQWYPLQAMATDLPDYRPQVLLYGDAGAQPFADDLMLALETIKRQRVPGLTVQRRNVADHTMVQGDADRQWIFWLSATTVPQAVLAQVKQGGILLQYVLVGASVGDFSGAGAPGRKVLRRDEQGRALLTRQLSGKGVIYRFNRQQPGQWTRWLDQSDFPAQLLGLMSATQALERRFVAPRLAAAQVVPATAKSPEPERTVAKRRTQTPLHNGLLLLLIVCWIGERWLAERPGPGRRQKQEQEQEQRQGGSQ